MSGLLRQTEEQQKLTDEQPATNKLEFSQEILREDIGADEECQADAPGPFALVVDEARFERDGVTYSVGAKDADGRYVPVGPDGKPLWAGSEKNAGDMTVNELEDPAGAREYN